MDKDTKFVLQSLAVDLARVALGLQRRSSKMATIFLKEALKRKSEVKMEVIKPSIAKILNRIDSNITAEEANKYSDLIITYSLNTNLKKQK